MEIERVSSASSVYFVRMGWKRVGMMLIHI